MGIINADELRKSYKLSILDKVKAEDIKDTDLIQIATAKDNPKYKETAAVEVSELAKYIGGDSSQVVPNPEGQATDTLEKLGIDGTVYGIPSGGGDGRFYVCDAVWDNRKNQYNLQNNLTIGDLLEQNSIGKIVVIRCTYEDKLTTVLFSTTETRSGGTENFLFFTSLIRPTSVSSEVAKFRYDWFRVAASGSEENFFMIESKYIAIATS